MRLPRSVALLALLVLAVSTVLAFWPVPGKYPFLLPAILVGAGLYGAYRWRRAADDFGALLVWTATPSGLAAWTLASWFQQTAVPAEGQVMPVIRYRSVEEMPTEQPARPGDPHNLSRALALSHGCLKLAGWRLPPGLHRFHSIQHANRWLDEQQQARLRVAG